MGSGSRVMIVYLASSMIHLVILAAIACRMAQIL
jgi:hypothetical protein